MNFLVAILCLMFALSLLPAPAAAQPPATLTGTEAQREQFRAARRHAESGPDGAWLESARGLEDYPLYPYLEYFDLRRRISSVSLQRVEDFLQRHGDIALAVNLRHAMQQRLLREQRWTDALALDQGGGPVSMRCGLARALLETGQHEALKPVALSLWMVGRSQHAACDPVFVWLRAQGEITSQRLQDRFRLAIEAGELGFARYLQQQLPSRSQPAAQRWLDMAQQPADALRLAFNWPADESVLEAIVHGVERLARQDSPAAAARWASLADRFEFSPAQRARAEAGIALYLATRFDASAAAMIDAMDDTARNDSLREWRVRLALDAGDWADALKALDALTPAQAQASRWRYLRARALNRLGRSREAAALLTPLSDEASYHGFLAADLLRRPYSICPLQLEPDIQVRATVLADHGLRRALELHALGELGWARREWDRALTRLSVPQRHQAVLLASAQGWHERGIWALASADHLRAYQWRFPLDHQSRIEAAARQSNVELPWVLALIRAESAWAPDARSGADARGLMQVLPSTAAEVARRNDLPYSGPQSLFSPEINIPLGNAYLGELGQRYDANPVLIAAAYNAGPGRTKRWLERPGPAEPDLWIETLSYRETRDYVARLLAFSVIYDWRLNGDARRLSSRMPRIGQPGALNGPRVPVECRDASEGDDANGPNPEGDS